MKHPSEITADQLKQLPTNPVVFPTEGGLNVRSLTHPYIVSDETVSSASELLGWVLHLCSKNWITTEKLSAFIVYHEKRGVKIKR